MHLPRELVDEVCGHLADSKSSLAACSRLSKHWHASARPLLFHTVTLSKPRLSHRRLGRFLKFLNRQSSVYVASLIKRFIIRAFYEDRFSTNVSKLEPILCKLPSLEAFQLEHVMLTCVGNGYRSSMHPKPLAHLRLSSVDFELPSRHGLTVHLMESRSDITVSCSLVELLNLFTSVKTLDLDDVMPTWEHFTLQDNTGARLIVGLAKAAGRRLASTFRVSEVKATMDTAPTQIQALEILRESGCLNSLQVFEVDEEAGPFNSLEKSTFSTVHSFGLSLSRFVDDRPDVSLAATC